MAHSATSTSFYNITKKISPSMVVYPGDPVFASEELLSCKRGDAFSLCHFHMSNHTGTHIDFPAHFIAGGKTSSDFKLTDFIGKALVIEIPEGISIITAANIPDDILEGDFVFFKTSNSHLKEYREDYVALDKSAAVALLDKKVKIVGIDYLSVDRFGDESFEVHKTLLGAGILVVENLELKDVPPGRYDARIYPMQVTDVDGVPITASLEK